MKRKRSKACFVGGVVAVAAGIVLAFVVLRGRCKPLSVGSTEASAPASLSVLLGLSLAEAWAVWTWLS